MWVGKGCACTDLIREGLCVYSLKYKRIVRAQTWARKDCAFTHLHVQIWIGTGSAYTDVGKKRLSVHRQTLVQKGGRCTDLGGEGLCVHIL